ncbi:MAG: hypothetical protein ACUVQP_08815 [Bacteroidales bacterium]
MLKPEILENEVVNKFARLLKVLLWEKRAKSLHKYVDDFLLDEKDENKKNEKRRSIFDGFIGDVLREAERWYHFCEKISVPTEQEVMELYRLANRDFDDVLLSLIILSHTEKE